MTNNLFWGEGLLCSLPPPLLLRYFPFSHRDFFFNLNFLYVLFIHFPLAPILFRKLYTNMARQMKAILSNHDDCAIFMDSHLLAYKKYIEIEAQYKFETREQTELQQYDIQTHLKEWHGENERMHPGRFIVRHYVNLLLNFVCDRHSTKQRVASDALRKRWVNFFLAFIKILIES